MSPLFLIVICYLPSRKPLAYMVNVVYIMLYLFKSVEAQLSSMHVMHIITVFELFVLKFDDIYLFFFMENRYPNKNVQI